MVKTEKVENWSRKWFILAVMAAVLMMFMRPIPAIAAGGLSMHADYPGMSVKPGDSLSIPITLENGSGASMNVSVSVSALPENWDGYLQGSSYHVNKVWLGAGEDNTQVTLRLTVPKELEQGEYHVRVSGETGEGIYDELDLTFLVAEQNAGNGSFTSEYPQQEGASGTNFSFSTTLINNDLKTQSYSLSANAPTGWSVSFTPSGQSTKVAAIDVESASSQGLTVSVTPPAGIEAGEYTISCSAVSAEETLNTELTVKITGTYGLKMSTPDGRLSFDAHAGKQSDVTLTVENTGNVDLENVTINSSLPSGWTVTYSVEDNVIESIPAGTTTEVIAHVKPSTDAITGDYVSSFSAKCKEASSSVDFRVSVKTQTIWGLAAIAVILCVVGGLGYVFRKYGRR